MKAIVEELFDFVLYIDVGTATFEPLNYFNAYFVISRSQFGQIFQNLKIFVLFHSKIKLDSMKTHVVKYIIFTAKLFEKRFIRDLSKKTLTLINQSFKMQHTTIPLSCFLHHLQSCSPRLIRQRPCHDDNESSTASLARCSQHHAQVPVTVTLIKADMITFTAESDRKNGRRISRPILK